MIDYLEELKEAKIRITCQTLKEAQELFSFFVNKGIIWNSGESVNTKNTKWDVYRENTYYTYCFKNSSGISYGDIKNTKGDKKVISYLEFMENQQFLNDVPIATKLTNGIPIYEKTKSDILHKHFKQIYECKWNWNNKIGEEKNMKTERIIDLWYKREKVRIEKEYDEKYNKILFNDEDVIKVKQHYEAICELAKSKGVSNFTNGLVINYNLLTSDGTDTQIIELEKEKESCLADLKANYEEIRIMVSACENYEQEIEVLKAYEIVDETGKMSV